MHRVKINNKKYLSRMGTILNFSKWERMYEQAEAEKGNYESLKKGDLAFHKNNDGSVVIEMFANIKQSNRIVELEFDGDKINVDSLDLEEAAQPGMDGHTRRENLTPDKALQLFFSFTELVRLDRINLSPKAKELATLILNNTDLESSPKGLIDMFQQLINSEGNILKGTFDYFPVANQAMAKAVKEFKESNPDKFKK